MGKISGSKKFLLFVFLLFIIVLFFVSHVFMISRSFSVSEIDVIVSSEAELLKVIRIAPADETSYVIGFNADISLKNSLVISEDKNITLTSIGGDVVWRLVGAKNQTVVNVLGFLVVDGIVITHVEGDHGGGVYVEHGGVLVLVDGAISGNTLYYGSNNMGGGVCNEGNFTMSGGVISGNTAVYGGGVSNFNGFFIIDLLHNLCFLFIVAYSCNKIKP